MPCQITPVRKMQLATQSYLDNGRKKEKHIERQTKFLKGYGSRVALNIGLLCTEVFTYEGLMVEKIQNEMGIPLTDVKKFNVKGKVLIYKKDGELVEMRLQEAQEYARPECHHCGDFSAELADISCGGVGAMDWTITILRTPRGEELFDRMVAEGLLEVRPMEEFENSMKVLLRLTKRQRERVPVPPGRTQFAFAPYSQPLTQCVSRVAAASGSFLLSLRAPLSRLSGMALSQMRAGMTRQKARKIANNMARPLLS